MCGFVSFASAVTTTELKDKPITTAASETKTERNDRISVKSRNSSIKSSYQPSFVRKYSFLISRKTLPVKESPSIAHIHLSAFAVAQKEKSKNKPKEVSCFGVHYDIFRNRNR